LDELRLQMDGLRMAIDALKDSWRRIVAMRYGWFGDPAMSFVRIGERCGLSRERIRQIVQQSLAIIGRKLQSKPRHVHDLLTILGDICDGPLLADRSSTPAPDPGALLDGCADDPALEEHFTVLSEHAKNWRERGEFVVFAPVPTLLARERFSTLDGAKKCVQALVAKGWAEWARGMDAVNLRRFDKLPAPRQMRRSNKRLHWLQRHGLDGKRTACRMPSPAQVLSFLDERATVRGKKRAVRPAVTLLCIQFRLEPQAAVRLLHHLQELGAVASSDEYKSVVMLKKRLPKRPECAHRPTSASRDWAGERTRRNSEVRLLNPGAARQAAAGAGEQRGRRQRSPSPAKISGAARS
jgi:hypothetical protein